MISLYYIVNKIMTLLLLPITSHYWHITSQLSQYYLDSVPQYFITKILSHYFPLIAKL